MRKITISFTTSKNQYAPFAWLICKLWGTEYSHTALIFHPTNISQDLVYHASAKGLNFMGIDIFKQHNKIIYEKTIEISDQSYKEIIEKAITYAGSDYGLLQAIGIGVAYCLKRMGLPKWNPFSDGRERWACSEWVSEALMVAYPKLIIDLETVSPQDVYNLVETL